MRLFVFRLLSHVWMPGSSVLHYSLEFAQFMSIKLVMISKHLILCCPHLLLPSIFPSVRVFSSESAIPIGWPKYWSFSFSINPSTEYLGLISFRIGLISLQSKGLSRISSRTTIRKHQFFSAQPSLWSDSHIRTWLLDHRKTIALTKQTFVGKVMSVLFNMLSKLSQFFFQVVSFNFMAAVTICSDVEAKKTKSVTVSTFSPSIPDVQS